MTLQTFKSVLLNLLRALAGAYALSVGGLLALRALVGETWALVGLFNNFLPWLLAPAFLLLPLTLLLRRRWLAFGQLALVGVFAWLYGEQFLPRAAALPAQARELRLLTFNLFAGRADPAAVTAILRDSGADVLAVQELAPQTAAHLQSALRDLYPYAALHPQQSATRGQGVFSRFPIVEDAYWQHADLPVTLGNQRVVLNVDGTHVTLYNVHPTHPGMTGRLYDDAVRGEEITRLLARAAGDAPHVLVMGDFNMSDQSDDYARMAAAFTDSYRRVGWGLGMTFPNVAYTNSLGFTLLRPFPVPPLVRLDYVWLGAAFTPLAAHVGAHSGGSDHFPLHVRVAR